MKLNIDFQEKFEQRHIAPNEQDTVLMLETVGVRSIDELIEQTVPSQIRLKKPLNLPPAKSEFDYLNDLRQLASQNKVFKSYMPKRSELAKSQLEQPFMMLMDDYELRANLRGLVTEILEKIDGN